MISIVIPIHNEQGNIREFYISLKEVLVSLNKTAEIIYVDDGSFDNSGNILREICAADPDVKLILFLKNYGQDAALAAGLGHSQGDVVIALDGDLQDNPKDIKLFLDKIEQGVDIVCGWRKKRAKRCFLKQWLALIANRTGRALFRLDLHDFNATFKAYNKDALKKLYFFKGFHRFIPVLAAMSGLRTEEVKIENNMRFSGYSKYSMLDMKRIISVVQTAALLKLVEFSSKTRLEEVFPQIYYDIAEKVNFTPVKVGSSDIK